MQTVICSDKSIKAKHLDKDGRVDSCRDGFIFRGTIQLTKTDVSKERLQPELEPRYDCNHSAFCPPLPFSSFPLSFAFSLPPSLLSLSLPLPPFLSHPLSVELIDYVSSIHLSLCRLATGALLGVEGGSFNRGGVGFWMEERWWWWGGMHGGVSKSQLYLIPHLF